MDLTTLAATITALGVVFGAIFAVHKWFLKQEKQDKEAQKKPGFLERLMKYIEQSKIAKKYPRQPLEEEAEEE